MQLQAKIMSQQVMKWYVTVNELCIMKWLVSSNEYQLCIGYIKQKVENGFFIDHLHWVVKKRNTQWAYPSTEDIQIAEKEQVLHCKLKGEWNLNDLRNIKYVYIYMFPKQMYRIFKYFMIIDYLKIKSLCN